MPKISKIGHFWPKSRKKAFFPGFTRKRPKRAFFGPLPRGFYINPSGTLPRGRGPGGPSRSPGGSRSPDPGSWACPGPLASQGPPLGEPRGPRKRGSGGSGPQRGPGTRPRTGFYINPSRRGPAVSRRGSRDRGPGGPKKGLPGSPWATPSQGGVQTTPRGPGGGGEPRRGSEGYPSLLPGGR